MSHPSSNLPNNFQDAECYHNSDDVSTSFHVQEAATEGDLRNKSKSTSGIVNADSSELLKSTSGLEKADSSELSHNNTDNNGAVSLALITDVIQSGNSTSLLPPNQEMDYYDSAEKYQDSKGLARGKIVRETEADCYLNMKAGTEELPPKNESPARERVQAAMSLKPSIVAKRGDESEVLLVKSETATELNCGATEEITRASLTDAICPTTSLVMWPARPKSLLSDNQITQEGEGACKSESNKQIENFVDGGEHRRVSGGEISAAEANTEALMAKVVSNRISVSSLGLEDALPVTMPIPGEAALTKSCGDVGACFTNITQPKRPRELSENNSTDFDGSSEYGPSENAPNKCNESEDRSFNQDQCDQMPSNPISSQLKGVSVLRDKEFHSSLREQQDKPERRLNTSTKEATHSSSVIVSADLQGSSDVKLNRREGVRWGCNGCETKLIGSREQGISKDKIESMPESAPEDKKVKTNKPVNDEFNCWIDHFIKRIGPNRESGKSRCQIFNYLRRLILQTLQEPTCDADCCDCAVGPSRQKKESSSHHHSQQNRRHRYHHHDRPRRHHLAIMRYGSLPLMTYLPDGDIDLVIATFDSHGVLQEDEDAEDCLDVLLQRFKEPSVADHPKFPIARPALVEAEVRVLKFSIRDVAIDLSVNKIGGACSFVMLDLFDRCLCRESHLFKRSVLLIKAWCSYESRTLGSRNGLMATYALEVMIICLLVTGGHKTACVDSACVDGHSSTSGQWHGVDTELPPLTTPLEVLRQFLHYYGSFEWGKFAVTACGPLPLSWLRETAEERNRRRDLNASTTSDVKGLNYLSPDNPPPNGAIFEEPEQESKRRPEQEYQSRLEKESKRGDNEGEFRNADRAVNVERLNSAGIDYRAQPYTRKTTMLGVTYHEGRCSTLPQHCDCLECSRGDPRFERQAVEVYNAVNDSDVFTRNKGEGTTDSREETRIFPVNVFPSATADFLEDCRRHFSRCFGPALSGNKETSSNRWTPAASNENCFDFRRQYDNRRRNPNHHGRNNSNSNRHGNKPSHHRPSISFVCPSDGSNRNSNSVAPTNRNSNQYHHHQGKYSANNAQMKQVSDLVSPRTVNGCENPHSSLDQAQYLARSATANDNFTNNQYGRDVDHRAFQPPTAAMTTASAATQKQSYQSQPEVDNGTHPQQQRDQQWKQGTHSLRRAGVAPSLCVSTHQSVSTSSSSGNAPNLSAVELRRSGSSTSWQNENEHIAPDQRQVGGFSGERSTSIGSEYHSEIEHQGSLNYDLQYCPCGAPLLPDDGFQWKPPCGYSDQYNHFTTPPIPTHFHTNHPHYHTHQSSHSQFQFATQFLVRTMNIVDPLQPFNNLGRSVSTGNFYRITESFKRSAKILESVLDTGQQYALKFFFKNSLRIINTSPSDLLPISVLPLPSIWFSGVPLTTPDQTNQTTSGDTGMPLTGKQSQCLSTHESSTHHPSSTEPLVLNSALSKNKKPGCLQPQQKEMSQHAPGFTSQNQQEQTQQEQNSKERHGSVESRSTATESNNAYPEGSLKNILQLIRIKGLQSTEISYVYPRIHRSFEEAIALLMAAILADLRKRRGYSSSSSKSRGRRRSSSIVTEWVERTRSESKQKMQLPADCPGGSISLAKLDLLTTIAAASCRDKINLSFCALDFSLRQKNQSPDTRAQSSLIDKFVAELCRCAFKADLPGCPLSRLRRKSTFRSSSLPVSIERYFGCEVGLRPSGRKKRELPHVLHGNVGIGSNSAVATFSKSIAPPATKQGRLAIGNDAIQRLVKNLYQSQSEATATKDMQVHKHVQAFLRRNVEAKDGKELSALAKENEPPQTKKSPISISSSPIRTIIGPTASFNEKRMLSSDFQADGETKNKSKEKNLDGNEKKFFEDCELTHQSSNSIDIFESDPVEVAALMSLCTALRHPFYARTPPAWFRQNPHQQLVPPVGSFPCCPPCWSRSCCLAWPHQQIPSSERRRRHSNSSRSEYTAWAKQSSRTVTESQDSMIPIQDSQTSSTTRIDSLPSFGSHQKAGSSAVPHPDGKAQSSLLSGVESAALSSATSNGLSSSFCLPCVTRDVPEPDIDGDILNLHQLQPNVAIATTRSAEFGSVTVTVDNEMMSRQNQEQTAQTAQQCSVPSANFQIQDGTGGVTAPDTMLQDSHKKTGFKRNEKKAVTVLRHSTKGVSRVVKAEGCFSITFRPILRGNLTLLRRYLNSVCGREFRNYAVQAQPVSPQRGRHQNLGRNTSKFKHGPQAAEKNVEMRADSIVSNSSIRTGKRNDVKQPESPIPESVKETLPHGQVFKVEPSGLDIPEQIAAKQFDSGSPTRNPRSVPLTSQVQPFVPSPNLNVSGETALANCAPQMTLQPEVLQTRQQPSSINFGFFCLDSSGKSNIDELQFGTPTLFNNAPSSSLSENPMERIQHNRIEALGNQDQLFRKTSKPPSHSPQLSSATGNFLPRAENKAQTYTKPQLVLAQLQALGLAPLETFASVGFVEQERLIWQAQAALDRVRALKNLTMDNFLGAANPTSFQSDPPLHTEKMAESNSLQLNNGVSNGSRISCLPPQQIPIPCKQMNAVFTQQGRTDIRQSAAISQYHEMSSQQAANDEQLSTTRQQASGSDAVFPPHIQRQFMEHQIMEQHHENPLGTRTLLDLAMQQRRLQIVDPNEEQSPYQVEQQFPQLRHLENEKRSCSDGDNVMSILKQIALAEGGTAESCLPSTSSSRTMLPQQPGSRALFEATVEPQKLMNGRTTGSCVKTEGQKYRGNRESTSEKIFVEGSLVSPILSAKVRGIPVVVPSRWLVHSGPLQQSSVSSIHPQTRLPFIHPTGSSPCIGQKHPVTPPQYHPNNPLVDVENMNPSMGVNFIRCCQALSENRSLSSTDVSSHSTEYPLRQLSTAPTSSSLAACSVALPSTSSGLWSEGFVESKVYQEPTQQTLASYTRCVSATISKSPQPALAIATSHSFPAATVPFSSPSSSPVTSTVGPTPCSDLSATGSLAVSKQQCNATILANQNGEDISERWSFFQCEDHQNRQVSYGSDHIGVPLSSHQQSTPGITGCHNRFQYPSTMPPPSSFHSSHSPSLPTSTHPRNQLNGSTTTCRSSSSEGMAYIDDSSNIGTNCKQLASSYGSRSSSSSSAVRDLSCSTNEPERQNQHDKYSASTSVTQSPPTLALLVDSGHGSSTGAVSAEQYCCAVEALLPPQKWKKTPETSESAFSSKQTISELLAEMPPRLEATEKANRKDSEKKQAVNEQSTFYPGSHSDEADVMSLMANCVENSHPSISSTLFNDYHDSITPLRQDQAKVSNGQDQAVVTNGPPRSAHSILSYASPTLTHNHYYITDAIAELSQYQLKQSLMGELLDGSSILGETAAELETSYCRSELPVGPNQVVVAGIIMNQNYISPLIVGSQIVLSPPPSFPAPSTPSETGYTKLTRQQTGDNNNGDNCGDDTNVCGSRDGSNRNGRDGIPWPWCSTKRKEGRACSQQETLSNTSWPKLSDDPILFPSSSLKSLSLSTAALQRAKRDAQSDSQFSTTKEGLSSNNHPTQKNGFSKAALSHYCLENVTSSTVSTEENRYLGNLPYSPRSRCSQDRMVRSQKKQGWPISSKDTNRTWKSVIRKAGRVDNDTRNTKRSSDMNLESHDPCQQPTYQQRKHDVDTNTSKITSYRPFREGSYNCQPEHLKQELTNQIDTRNMARKHRHDASTLVTNNHDSNHDNTHFRTKSSLVVDNGRAVACNSGNGHQVWTVVPSKRQDATVHSDAYSDRYYQRVRPSPHRTKGSPTTRSWYDFPEINVPLFGYGRDAFDCQSLPHSHPDLFSIRKEAILLRHCRRKCSASERKENVNNNNLSATQQQRDDDRKSWKQRDDDSCSVKPSESNLSPDEELSDKWDDSGSVDVVTTGDDQQEGRVSINGVTNTEGTTNTDGVIDTEKITSTEENLPESVESPELLESPESVTAAIYGDESRLLAARRLLSLCSHRGALLKDSGQIRWFNSLRDEMDQEKDLEQERDSEQLENLENLENFELQNVESLGASTQTTVTDNQSSANPSRCHFSSPDSAPSDYSGSTAATRELDTGNNNGVPTPDPNKVMPNKVMIDSALHRQHSHHSTERSAVTRPCPSSNTLMLSWPLLPCVCFYPARDHINIPWLLQPDNSRSSSLFPVTPGRKLFCFRSMRQLSVACFRERKSTVPIVRCVLDETSRPVSVYQWRDRRQR